MCTLYNWLYGDQVTSKYISNSQSSLGSLDSILSSFRRSDDSNDCDCWYKVAMFTILGWQDKYFIKYYIKYLQFLIQALPGNILLIFSLFSYFCVNIESNRCVPQPLLRRGEFCLKYFPKYKYFSQVPGGRAKVENVASELGFNLVGRIVEDHYLLEASHTKRYVENFINWIFIPWNWEIFTPIHPL